MSTIIEYLYIINLRIRLNPSRRPWNLEIHHLLSHSTALIHRLLRRHKAPQQNRAPRIRFFPLEFSKSFADGGGGLIVNLEKGVMVCLCWKVTTRDSLAQFPPGKRHSSSFRLSLSLASVLVLISLSWYGGLSSAFLYLLGLDLYYVSRCN